MVSGSIAGAAFSGAGLKTPVSGAGSLSVVKSGAAASAESLAGALSVIGISRCG
jgi:hypothetical protein